jgi:hypothetical protein
MEKICIFVIDYVCETKKLAAGIPPVPEDEDDAVFQRNSRCASDVQRYIHP